ncbi:copper chaperone PCu(A)C [Puniceibacterium sediminis]|uniref:Copper(I)-binding protein n=1 Tax=Puniceibacterium sediminis TaxID=1608407 RepID=A0A238ZV61_9RHOB|nr:copper chaperone PCu(A)C [Puniceibacterium sediminis]SNR87230.1 hypothetical protein SAMN06265370_1447 [Puniceibacterium sediminis]
MKTLFAAALICALPALVSANEITSGNITVGHPYAFETPPMAHTAAGYMTVTNTGDSADTLLSIESELPKTMLHESKETDGVATMTHVEKLEIAPGETVEFAPGGYHIMFMGLNDETFEVGETVPVTLIFEHLGRMEIELDVQARNGDGQGADAKSDHATH